MIFWLMFVVGCALGFATKGRVLSKSKPEPSVFMALMRVQSWRWNSP